VSVIVVGHQPQFMPYLGILNKISRADIFVIVDHVQYVKKYFYNRTYIKVNDDRQLLTIPVLTKGQYCDPINKIKISYAVPWIKKHLKTISLAYRKARYFNDYFNKIEAIYQKQHICLSDFTSELLIWFLRQFDLVEDIRFSSDMQLQGAKTSLLVELTRAVGGDTYISGEGARDYFDDELFARSGYKHIFNQFSHPVYPQLGKTFMEGMACLDLLFNCGPDGRKYIVSNEFPKEDSDRNVTMLEER